MKNRNSEANLGTKLIHAGRREEWTGAVVNPPIWRASTHLYDCCDALEKGKSSNEDGRFFYGRRGAPTQWALADALTGLEEGADGTVLYPSGLAAITGALMAVLRPGDVVLISDNAYDPTRSYGINFLKNWGVETRFFDPLDVDGFAEQFCPRTKATLLENPGSLTMELCDIPALAAITREKGAVSLIDNTWATSIGFPALKHGCDIAIMALTKHVGGHSDLLMGSASAPAPLYKKLRDTAQSIGHVVSPDDAALALRGLRTMGLRLEHTSRSALKIATWLQSREEVAHMLCPMLPGTDGHEIWKRDFTHGCGLFSFVLKGRDETARARFIDSLKLFGIGYSWGGFESLAIPIHPSQNRSVMAWPKAGWDAGDRYAIRLAIGLEDADDLIADLAQAFNAMEQN